MPKDAVGNIERMVVTRVIDAPREIVWKAYTQPEYVQQWWGPKDFTSPSCRSDFRVGGTFLYCMRSPDGVKGGRAEHFTRSFRMRRSCIRCTSLIRTETEWTRNHRHRARSHRGRIRRGTIRRSRRRPNENHADRKRKHGKRPSQRPTRGQRADSRQTRRRRRFALAGSAKGEVAPRRAVLGQRSG